MVARPFWILGHNTNSLALVRKAVDEGANALEIDVHDAPDGRWVVSHDAPTPDAPELGEFLRQVSGVAREHPALCLVTLDCKTYNPSLADRLLSLARDNWALLSGAAFTRPFMVSVPHRENLGLFGPIIGELRELEGLMIDEDNDPALVATALSRARNPCFGDGITSLLPGPHVRPAIELATAIKARDASIKFTYSWTFTQMSSLREQVEIGVDGIITDNVSGLLSLVRGPYASTVRLATATDNPFATDVPSYGLAVHTSAGPRPAGSIEITLHGDGLTATKVVDTSPAGRFEPLSTTFVTILGQDAGKPRSISARALNAPFPLDSIQLLTSAGGFTLPVARFESVLTPGVAVERPIGA